MGRTSYEEIRIGPFTGGLNTLSDQTSINDLELFRMVNFECDKDGSLVSRPPIFKASPTANIAGVGDHSNLKILGFYVEASTGTYYIIGSTGGSGQTKYYANGVWTLITGAFSATACVQYRDKLYLLAPLTTSAKGGTWTPTGGFVEDATMPKGAAMVLNKERLWIAQGKSAPTNGARVYVSDISSGALVWDGDFINVSQGDGQNIVDLAVVYSDLVIFKQRSTYRFSYGADVATGAVTRLSENIGASETGCYAAYENQLFVLFDGNVYDFSNYIFNRLNYTVPLKATNPSASLTEKQSISVWADRVFVSFYDRLFVYSLVTRTWCEWESPNRVKTFGRFFALPVDQGVSPTAVVYSTRPAGTAEANYLYIIRDNFDSVGADEYTSEPYTCFFETKNYDYQTPAKFKRLGMWGADILSRTNINVAAKPVSYGSGATWDQMRAYTWDSRRDYTWDRPLDLTFVVSDNVSVEGLTGGRKWVKFMKSLRFRQIAFFGSANTTGTSKDAPIRIFSLATYIKEKQLVSRKVN